MEPIEERRPGISRTGSAEPETPRPLRVANATDPTPSSSASSASGKNGVNGTDGANGSNGERHRPPPIPTQPPSSQLAPIITTTLPSPSLPAEETLTTPTDRRPQRRKSFHPVPVNTAFSREVLLTSRTGILPGAAGLTVDADKASAEEALLSNVEEMLEGFDWTTGVGSAAKKGSADAIESRLLDELAALDSVSATSSLRVCGLTPRRTFMPSSSRMTGSRRSWGISTRR